MNPPPSSSPLSKLRCARHPDREAAARCASCGLVFCRECVSEHDGRFLCAPCLAKTAAAARAAAARRPRVAALKRALAIVAGAAWLWLCFYLAGLLIEKLPRDFHEGTVWRTEEPGTTSDAVSRNDGIFDFRFSILDWALPRRIVAGASSSRAGSRMLPLLYGAEAPNRKSRIENRKLPPEDSP